MRSVLKYACLVALILCLLCSALACTPTPDNNPDDQSQEETTAGEVSTDDETTSEEETTDGVTGDEATTEDVTTEEATTVDGPGLELYPDETDADFDGVVRN